MHNHRAVRLAALQAALAHGNLEQAGATASPGRYALIGVREHTAEEHLLGVCIDGDEIEALAGRAAEQGFHATDAVDLDASVSDCTRWVRRDALTDRWTFDINDPPGPSRWG